MIGEQLAGALLLGGPGQIDPHAPELQVGIGDVGGETGQINDAVVDDGARQAGIGIVTKDLKESAEGLNPLPRLLEIF